MAKNLAEVLHLADAQRHSPEEREVFHRHGPELAPQAPSVTEHLWQWWAENSQSAKHISELAEAQTQPLKSNIAEHFRDLCLADCDATRADNQIALGALAHQLALNDQWISDTYKAARQFLEPVFEKFSPHDRELLRRAVQKRLQLDEGCALIGYRQAHQESLQQHEALYEAIRVANQLLAHHTDAGLLLDSIVNTLAHHLKAPLLGIGFINPRTGHIRIRTSAGPAKAYFSNVTLSASAEVPEGRGPGGRALSANQVMQIDNFAEDPTFDPWRIPAQRFGLVGSITAPFKTRGGQQGFLSLYRTADIPFPKDTANLLQQLARDIGGALDRIHAQRELRRLHSYEDALDTNTPVVRLFQRPRRGVEYWKVLQNARRKS